ncbi:hypothetical protein OAH56_00665 [Gammaproteobacteria bacterium]|nr:hypothetical protein [Gammaproteobacteria bacterium]
MKNIILCDIDGTIANNDHRQHFLEGRKDWERFFSELILDKPIYKIIENVKKLSKDRDVIFITGRPERYRYSTISWLKEYFNFEIVLYMRNDNDLRTKVETKKDIFNSINIDIDSVSHVFENDLDLIEMWEEMGLNVIDINLLLS